jgi:pyridoxal phosphate enzyme (YggS family)
MLENRVDIPAGGYDISANLRRVRERIQSAADRAGRDPSGIKLVAVTKTHPIEVVRAAYQAGIRDFGENRAEEGVDKIPAFHAWLAERADGPPPAWHMIGHVQSRKAGDALTHFHMIHSVDSLKLAERLNRLAERDAEVALYSGESLRKRLPMPVLLECNVSGEASKYGFELSRWRENRQIRADFFGTVRGILGLPHLCLQGLMTMAPIVPDPEQTRPVFVALRLLRETLADEFPSAEWRHLSMGMTDDFEVAIEEGATLVRIGRAIFGPRACEL